MKKKITKYIHNETFHNVAAAQEIVPEVLSLVDVKSVVDVGCGIGTFLYCFKENGVKEILGIDGKWVNKNLLYKYISPREFREINLEENFKLSKRYDLVVSLEVAEHLSEQSADTFIRNLVLAGNVILFSAAIPLQGGQNHLNEQWLTYWEEKFLKHNYIIHDVLRPVFWDNPKIFTWYKQNMVLVTPRDYIFKKKMYYNPIRNIVHYDQYTTKLEQYYRVIRGELPVRKYIKLLIMSIVGKNRINHIKRVFTKQ